MIYELLATIIGVVGAMLIVDDTGRKSTGGKSAIGIVMVIGSLAWLWNLIT